MSKNEAVGRLVRLIEHFDAATIVRLADDIEDSLEVGPYGVCHLDGSLGSGPPNRTGTRRELAECLGSGE